MNYPSIIKKRETARCAGGTRCTAAAPTESAAGPTRLRTFEYPAGLGLYERGQLIEQPPSYKKERETGFEPATPTLARLYSTPEPLAQTISQNPD